MKIFIDEFKEKFDGVIGEKILISYNSEDFYDLSELKNTLDSNFENLHVYILLKTNSPHVILRNDILFSL